MLRPETSYVRSRQAHVAYQVFGDGPLDLLVLAEWAASVDGCWEHPGHLRLWRNLSSFARVVRFDPRGVGSSDVVGLGEIGDLESWADDASAVLDAVGIDEVAVVGEGYAGHAALLLAKREPERVRRVLLQNSFARLSRCDGYDAGFTPDAAEQFVQGIEAVWGTGSIVAAFGPTFGGDADFCARFERLAAGPSTAAAMARRALASDVRPLLQTLTVPIAISHTGDIGYVERAHIDEFRRLLPDAEFFEHPSTTFYWAEESVPAIQFLTGELLETSERTLATVMFTDVVSSTVRAAELGDARWRETLDFVDDFVESHVLRNGGRVIKQTGDGHLAEFTQPGGALRAARSIQRSIDVLGVEMRIGIHTGEIERRGDDIGGMAVHVAARIAGLAGAREVLVSRTVAELVDGSDVNFEDRGDHELKGVPGARRILAVSAL